MTTQDSRYPYTYACDLIRTKGGYDSTGTRLSRSNASQIRQLFAKVLDIPDDELARKLADYYLSNQEGVTADGFMQFQRAQKQSDT